MSGLTIRPATPGDAEACLAIYAPIVRETAISFELEPPTPEEMRDRIRAANATHAWLVGVRGDVVCGYAYASAFRARPAYRLTAETTVYVAEAARGEGVGRALYTALLGILRERGFRVAVGVVALPNETSERLHERLGFRRVGVFHHVGFKHGRFHDSAWWERDLQAV